MREMLGEEKEREGVRFKRGRGTRERIKGVEGREKGLNRKATWGSEEIKRK